MLAAAMILALAVSEPQPGDPVRIDAGAVILEGTLAAHDATGWRLRMTNGEILVPADLARSVTLRVGGVSLPPVPPKPTLVPLTARSRAPRLGSRGGPWITRFPALVTLAAGGAPITRDTAFRERTNAFAMGGGLAAEIGVRFLAIGANAGFERAAAQLVSSGGNACRRDVPDRCFAFPAGLNHETQAFHGGVWLKPNLVLGAVRVWGQAGFESTQLTWAYHNGSKRYGGGTASAGAPVFGGGLDWATPARAWVVSVGVYAGGPVYREKIPDLLGRPWESRDSPSRPPVRATLGLSIPIGGRE